MKIKKKQYNKDLLNQYQTGFNLGTQQQIRTADALRARNESLLKKVGDLEGQVYKLTHTEETKADTEEAFKRGETHQKNKFAAWLDAQSRAIRTEVSGQS